MQVKHKDDQARLDATRPEGGVISSQPLELSDVFPHGLSAKCDFPRDCPKFIVRQGHAWET